jgi:hypothetical protein
MNLDFLEKIVNAVFEAQNGSPIKDFLSDEEIIIALSMLADILVCTGVQIKTYQEPNHEQTN